MSNAGKTVLVVDDEELLRDAIVFQFKREGYNVLSAGNGLEAFEIIKTNKIDAIVSDIQMPGGNGIDLLKAVKEYNANIPVLVFITAFADITESEAYDLGANAIFTKPFDRKALTACIKNAVDHEGRLWKLSSSSELHSDRKLKATNIAPLGRGGAFIEIENAPYIVGDIVEFDLTAKFGEKDIVLKGVGKVRWTRLKSEKFPPGVGIEFLKLEDLNVDEYESWLSQNRVKAYIPLKAS